MNQIDKYVQRLSKKINSRNTQWIDKNFIEPDRFSFNLCSSNYSDSVYAVLHNSRARGYQIPYEISEFNDLEINMNVEELIETLKDDVNNDELLNQLKSFTEKQGVNVEGKSILSVIWANILQNVISNENTELNADLGNVFFLVVNEASGTDNVKIEQLINETTSVFADSSKVKDYLNLTMLELQDDSLWYDYSVFPAVDVSEKMNNNLEINNNEELLIALNDFSNLPSVISYIKSNYLSDEDKKSAGYCKDELIQEYKAFVVALKLLEDKRFKNEDFDSNNNIGFNLNTKLNALENFIRQDYPNYKNSEVISGFKAQSRKVASQILGKDTCNVYGVWKNVVRSYIKKCNEIAKQVMNENLTPSSRKYLKTMGLITDRQFIKNYDVLLSQIKNKVDDASKLLSYLTPKDIDKLPADPFIDKSRSLYNELTSWSTSVKETNARPLKLAHIQVESLSANLKEFAMVAKRQPAKISKTLTPANQVGLPTQMSFDDFEEKE